ncbi:hypothetical protein RU639_013048 [Aspergillus parasiticus]
MSVEPTDTNRRSSAGIGCYYFSSGKWARYTNQLPGNRQPLLPCQSHISTVEVVSIAVRNEGYRVRTLPASF